MKLTAVAWQAVVVCLSIVGAAVLAGTGHPVPAFFEPIARTATGIGFGHAALSAAGASSAPASPAVKPTATPAASSQAVIPTLASVQSVPQGLSATP